MMIAAIRAAILKPQDFKTALFHSTPILQRNHQSNSKTRSKRLGNKKNWCDGFDFSGKHTSWFEKQYSRVSKRNRNGRHVPPNLDKRSLDFCGVDDGYEAEYFIRSALGGSRGFSFSFMNEEKRTQGRRGRGFSGSNDHEEEEARSWRDSSNFERSWRSRYRLDEEEDNCSSDSESDQGSHRHTLGLSSSGPLNLEDVKMHRHHDSTKDADEEKFKLRTVAYRSLCDRLAIN